MWVCEIGLHKAKCILYTYQALSVSDICDLLFFLPLHLLDSPPMSNGVAAVWQMLCHCQSDGWSVWGVKVSENFVDSLSKIFFSKNRFSQHKNNTQCEADSRCFAKCRPKFCPAVHRPLQDITHLVDNCLDFWRIHGEDTIFSHMLDSLLYHFIATDEKNLIVNE